MATHRQSSRERFEQYRRDLKSKMTEGSKGTQTSKAKASHGQQQPSLAVDRKPARRKRSFFKLFREFLKQLRGHRWVIGATLGTATIATIINLIPPAAIGFVVDYVLGGKSISSADAPTIVQKLPIPENPKVTLALVALGMMLLAFVSISLSMWGRWHATRATKRVQASVRKKVFDHAVQLPLHQIQKMKTGGITSILREDAGGIADLIFSMLYNPWKAIVTLIGTLIILAMIDWKLLLGSLVLLPIVYFTHRTWIARIRPVYHDIRISRQHMDGHATEAFGGMRVVRSFGRQRSEALRFIRNNHMMIRQELLAWWWARGVDIAWSILIPAASAALLWYGGARVLDGSLSVGQLLAFLLYVAMLLEPLGMLAASATAFQTSLAALDRVLDLLGEPQEMKPSPDSVRVTTGSVAGRITLKDVSFMYPGSDETVLHDINLDINPGELVALVGPSGSGKTTLSNIIARFYDPTEGRIELDGRDLRDIDVESYRRLLGIVEQDIFLFDGTIADNIGYGRRNAIRNEIMDAAHLANAHDFIMGFSHGYDTIVGERGVRLSGGQRQRLAIARAILADPKILILDEATSNLDSESERLIQQSLMTLMSGRTSFVIAHRLSTIRHADRIVVLDGGEVVEQGTHEQLMQRSGRYERLVFAQLQHDDGRAAAGNGQRAAGLTAADA